MKRIRTLLGLSVALTGRCSQPRSALVRLLKAKGAHLTTTGAKVTFETALLVRGISSSWKHSDYGRKEASALEFIRRGSQLSIILAEDLDQLLLGHAVSENEYVAGHRVDVLRDQAAIDWLQQLEDFKRSQQTTKQTPLPPPTHLFAGRLDTGVTAKQRLEQARLRDVHFADRNRAACSICGRDLPVNLLVAGHIKRRSSCSQGEKRDLSHIAMPICLLGCDVLYERGFLTVSPKGQVVISTRAFRTRALSSALHHLSGRRCLAHSSATEDYFAWHRENRFMAGV